MPLASKYASATASAAPVASTAGSSVAAAATGTPAAARARGGLIAPGGFVPVAPNKRDAVTVPDGYRYDLIARWGDSVVASAPLGWLGSGGEYGLGVFLLTGFLGFTIFTRLLWAAIGATRVKHLVAASSAEIHSRVFACAGVLAAEPLLYAGVVVSDALTMLRPVLPVVGGIVNVDRTI